MFYGWITEIDKSKVDSLFISHLTNVSVNSHTKVHKSGVSITGISFARAVEQGAALAVKKRKKKKSSRHAEKSGVIARRKMTAVLCKKNKQPVFFLEPPALPKLWDFSDISCC